MISETDYILSFYQPLSIFGDKPNIELVKNTSTGQLYVKKTLSVYDRTVFDFIFRFHPQNVPRIIELLEDGGELIVIEEYISGRSLREILDERGVLSVQEVRTLIISLINILIPFHSLNPPIVHRDIKPENLLISSDGMLKLMDFNAAKVSSPDKKRDTELFGTHGYAAPEQYGFSASTPATDIYAIGILLTELSTGKLDPSAVPADLFWVAERCTRMEPAARYQSIFELLADLQRQPDRSTAPEADRRINPAQAKDSFSQTPFPQTDAFLREAYLSTSAAESPTPDAYFGVPPEKESRRKWLPPGFRTQVWWKMLIGTLGYALILLLTYAGGSAQTNLPARLLEYAFVFIPSITTVAVLFNYGGIWKRLPLLKSSKPGLRVLGLILYPLFNVAATLLLVILIGMIFNIQLTEY
ncbi:MAG: serine/threonine protein kinase [Lachnospiraceae bacterium]|nr:serine/threonine protein kinase [Lachnospiraceae bacterium]